MKVFRVDSCHDCPYCSSDYYGASWCLKASTVQDATKHYLNKTLPDWCPLERHEIKIADCNKCPFCGYDATTDAHWCVNVTEDRNVETHYTLETTPDWCPLEEVEDENL